jgi:predicted  nucleic acid-binding Zn-ribbon protein
MERTIDEIKKAERAMQELLNVAAQLRKQIELASEKNPEQIAGLVEAAAGFEREAQKIKDYLQQWRQSIQ